MPIPDHLAELEALARLAHTLASATAGESSGPCHAMARALEVRLKTLAAGARLGTHQM